MFLLGIAVDQELRHDEGLSIALCLIAGCLGLHKAHAALFPLCHFAWASLELFTGLSWLSLGRGCYHSFCWEVATILELLWSSSNFHWGVFCFGTSHPRFIYNNMILWSMSVFTGFLCWWNYLYSQHLKMPQTLQDSGFFVFPGLSWHVLTFLFT